MKYPARRVPSQKFVCLWHSLCETAAGLALQNISDETATVYIYLYSNEGEIIETVPASILAHGQRAISLDVDGNYVGWVKIISNKNLNGFALIGDSAPSTMYDIDLKSELHHTFYLPHVAADTEWDSTIMICNPNNATARIYFHYFTPGGREPYTARSVDIPANGSLQQSVYNIHGIPLSGGSFKVESITYPINIFMLYDGTRSGQNNWKAGLSAIPTD